MRHISLVTGLLLTSLVAAAADSAATKPTATMPAATSAASGASATGAAAASASPTGAKSQLANTDGPWASAKKGTAIVTLLAGGEKRTDEVVAVDAATATIKMTIGSNAAAVERKVQRKLSPTIMQLTIDSWGTKSGEENIKIGGVDYKCEVYSRQSQLLDKMVTTRVYINREVPGWVVRSDNDASGVMATAGEVVQIIP